ncbi:MAG: 3-dehydroquinate synthase, partial [Candidatus Accumulibacter sp.]|nr:3-dehydroquinate synthase [Accumulibacter sp.]
VLLNLGHTFAHAIETGVGYGVWSHGEAVSAGCVLAAEVSRRAGWISDDDFRRVEDLFSRAGTPVFGPEGVAAESLVELMRRDKKVEDGKIRLVLLRALGDAFVSDAVAPPELARAFKARTLRA